MEYDLNVIINDDEEEANEKPPTHMQDEELLQKNNKRDLSLNNLPSNLFNLVCMFLNASDIVKLLCTSRQIREKVEFQAQFALSAISQRLFFSSEIDKYVDYGEETGYIMNKSRKDLQIADFMKCVVKDQLRDYSQVKKYVQKYPKLNLLNSLFPNIHNPPIPTMKIRRDNVGMHAHSWFQNKLVDVFYENQQKDLKQVKEDNFSDFSLFSTGKQFSFISRYQPKALKQLSLQIQAEQQLVTEHRQISLQLPSGKQRSQAVLTLLEAIRWYRNFNEISLLENFENNQSDTYFENSQDQFSQDLSSHPSIKQYMKENPCILTILLTSSAFKNQCTTIKHYLECNYHLGSYYDLLSEYNLKWNAFQASLIEIQENLEEVYQSFNDLYQTEVGVKMYPQYTLLRVATQHWANIVFSPLKDYLFESFFTILQDRRQNNLDYVITSDSSRIDPKLISIYYFPEKLENTPKEIQQKYSRSQLQLGVWNNKDWMFGRQSDKNKNDFFCQNAYFVDGILSSFSENMMDLSVNEASVHWLGHSEIQVGSTYSQFSDLFINLTSKYFDNLYSTIFQGYLIEWKRFLLGELKYNRKIVKELTLKNLNKLVIDKFYQGFSFEVQQNFCSSDSSLTIAGVPKEKQPIQAYLQAKGISELAILKIVNDFKLRPLLQELLAMKEQEEDFNQKFARDEDIEDINRYRHIKRRLDEDSFAFYDIIGQPDQELIEKTKNTIRQKTQEQGNESKFFQNKQHQRHHNQPPFNNSNFIHQTQNITRFSNQQGGHITFPLPLFHPPSSFQRVQQRNQPSQSQGQKVQNLNCRKVTIEKS